MQMTEPEQHVDGNLMLFELPHLSLHHHKLQIKTLLLTERWSQHLRL